MKPIQYKRIYAYFVIITDAIVLLYTYLEYRSDHLGWHMVVTYLFFILTILCARYLLKFQLMYYNSKYIDSLTEDANENEFRLEFDQLRKDPSKKYVFIYINIKKFSSIDSQFGYAFGDTVLKKIYKALKGALQEDEYISRNRADTFYILLKAGDEDMLSERIMQLDDAIYYLEDLGIDRKLFLSMGCYFIKNDEETFEHVVECANYIRTASPDAFDENTHYEIYGVTFQDTRVREKELSKMAKPALEQKHFQVYLQPKYELEHETLIEAEALIRWIDPQRGMMPLYEFMPLFEKNGFIRQIDYYIFDSTLQLLQKWIDEGKQPIKISVNLSKSHFTADEFFESRFMPIFERYHVPKEYIEFEISESTLLDNEEQLINFVKQVREKGFSCSMDDFGSGYSCLNTMKSLPVSVIKLDRKMFSEEEKEKGKIVSKGIIDIAKKLNIKVVAEGVETREYVDFLKEEKCDMVQGYFFGKPMPIAEFEQQMERDFHPELNKTKA